MIVTSLIKVYPRVCGGTPIELKGLMPIWGLSPRVRGNPKTDDGRPVVVWSIPACAGEPPTLKANVIVARVYPRVCGGTESPEDAQDPEAGLSPRVRGNLCRGVRFWSVVGSIPACAGEPCRAGSVGGRPWVYPRVCGGTSAAGRF